MKDFIIYIFRFAAISVTFYIIGICIWGFIVPNRFGANLAFIQGAYGHMFTRLKDVNNFSNIDILFIGSSRAYRGFDNRIFSAHGRSSFNLGSSAQTPIQSLSLIRTFSEKLTPELIVMEISPELLGNNGVESDLDIISNGRVDLNVVRMAIDVNNLKVYNSLLFSFFSDLFGHKNKFVEDTFIGFDTYVPGGYVEKKMMYHNYRPLSKREIVISDKQVDALNKIVEFSDQNNQQLIFVSSPVTKNLFSSYENFEEFESFMSKYDQFYNFNKLIKLDDSLHFYNQEHLNQDGVQKYNVALLKILLSEGYLQ